ncbi:VOC family protein [Methylobacterium isbiliense]|uniref:VOC family protein n=1 Tax=Methylobacterium isbiliense TaxID=315478 RepID=UPI0025B2DFCA|nr:VOC family protein [Methylobacterium isbiliense]MDN3627490.1 VOC family protein [Methylobacterium isbiliense]
MTPPRLLLDHVAIAANSLEAGVAAVEEALGVAFGPGGQHREMGTHNRLLRLGSDLFLEVIAIDPAAPPPGRPRWFAFDAAGTAARLAAPRPWTWVIRADGDPEAARAALPPALGPFVRVSRGALAWRLTVPEDGGMALDGYLPALIAWPEGPHPAARMAEAGCGLRRLTVVHPQAERIRAPLAALLDADRRVAVETGPPHLAIEIDTPHGPRRLG